MSFYTQLNTDANQRMLNNLGTQDTNNYMRNSNTKTYYGEYTLATKYTTMTYFAKSDYAGTLYIDGNYNSVTNGEVIKTFPLTANIGISGTINVFSKYHRVRFVSSVSNPTTTSTNVNLFFHSTKAPDEVNFNTDVPLGKVPNVSVKNLFGYNTDVDIGTEVLASFGGTWTPLTAASTLTIVSSSANDDFTPPNTGAWFIYIEGIDSNWAIQTETITLNGTSNVVTATTWRGINNCFVAYSGTNLTNVGDISVKSTTGSFNMAFIPAGSGRSQQIIYHTPLGHTTLANSLVLNVEKIVTAANPKAIFKAWLFASSTNTKYEIFRAALDANVTTYVQIVPPQPFLFGEKTVFWVECTTDIADTYVTGRLTLQDIIN